MPTSQKATEWKINRLLDKEEREGLTAEEKKLLSELQRNWYDMTAPHTVYRPYY